MGLRWMQSLGVRNRYTPTCVATRALVGVQQSNVGLPSLLRLILGEKDEIVVHGTC